MNDLYPRVALALTLATASCGTKQTTAAEVVDAIVADAAQDAVAVDPSATEPDFAPRLVRPSSAIAPVRDFVVRQGHLHGHTVFSHDACDGSPRVNGETGDRNEQCFWDFRDGVCDNQLDFMFITDHPSGMFCDFEYPAEMLYEPGQGDELVNRDGSPVANRAKCKDGHKVLLVPGFDNQMITVGLEKHLRDKPADRHALYESKTNATIDEVHAKGHGLVVAGYASDWPRDEIGALNWDGYEVFNPSTLMHTHMAQLLPAVADMVSDPDNSPAPELALLSVFEEGAENMQFWSDIVQKRRVFNYIGPNAHRNTLAMEMADGDRGDSYRRVFHWFGNFVLLPKANADAPTDRDYKDALSAGRIYNAFLFYGYPVGFDFYAEQAGQVFEMGAQLPSADGVTLHVAVPRVYGKMPAGTQAPVITAKVLKAVKDGWQEVAKGDKDFDVAVKDAGVYRVDVRIVANHLKKWLGATPEKYLTERTWVYSGTMYVGTKYPMP